MNHSEALVIFIIGSLTIMAFVLFLVLIVIEYRKRQVRHITDQLKLKHQYENQLLQVKLEVQEESFKYVSEEIHDNIAQTLSLAKLKLYKTAEKADSDAVKNGLATSTDLVSNALKDLRNLSHVLNGGLIAKLSLKDSIEKELSYIRDVKDIHVSLIAQSILPDIDDEKKLMAFRIVQEAMSNAIKHGDAKEITITLSSEEKTLKIQVADNGKGFDPTQIEAGKGLGLHNMHLRAKMLGSISIQSQKNNGTSITLNINTNE